MSLPHSQPFASDPPHRSREHRRRRMKRHGRRAYIRSVYFLPSLATLGNAICGFGACYVAAMTLSTAGADPVARWAAEHRFTFAAGLIFLAMVFDALDGRLARFARHTTDFGGQLDSLADVISFGFAPAFIVLQLFKTQGPQDLPLAFSRLVWAIGALYMACAAIRLARFNVSNEHGEQHHFSFLGLPSPGAGGAVAAFVLMQQELYKNYLDTGLQAFAVLSKVCLWLLPPIVLGTGLLMVSNIRYPHVVNRYLRGRRSIGRLVAVVAVVLLLITYPQYTLGLGTLVYAFWGATSVGLAKLRRKPTVGPPAA
ncbi:MAG TPA: CDP-alcohol phosphatidyltransferase family protein [Tepidisphaeraceae bacterium]|nr:CDP-alcohol phosphatidyltransferase family protein [Tepidisphaeraceae bacterium]